MEIRQQQLDRLRRRIAHIERKFTGPPRGLVQPPRDRTPGRFIDELMSGEVVRTAHGEHFETEKLWEPHRRYGSVGISDLADLPEDLLEALSGGAIARSRPSRWAFLDTETTGLSADRGACAFLVGVGSIDAAGFRLRQFFMREYGEEVSLLARLAEYLSQFDVLITFNGKIFDQPLLETRFRLGRSRDPFARMQHLDLLFGARRLWKLRLENCRLMNLEQQILGVEREGDLPGEMIPYYYSDYLRTQQAIRLVPIFHHNALDILSLACLTAVVPLAFRSPEEAPVRHGSDLIGLARWLQAEDPEQAIRLLRRAVHLGLPDNLLFRTLWDLGLLEKLQGRPAAAAEAFRDLAAERNPYRARAYEELAKHYERHERDYATALEMTRSALALGSTPQILRREARLTKRMARPAPPVRS